MTSTLEIKKVCQYCGGYFPAQKVTTRYCSHKCNRRAYKEIQKQKRIENNNLETRKIINLSIEEIKANEFLTVRQVSKLLNCSKQNIYKMINHGTLKATNILIKKTLVKRSEIDKLFDKPFQPAEKKFPEPIKEFYTVKDIEEKYSVKYRTLAKIVKENKIPNEFFNSKLNYSKKHIDSYFEKTRKNLKDIAEWYTVEDIISKYNFSIKWIYNTINKKNIPKIRIGRNVRISKIHFDKVLINENTSIVK